MTISPKTKTKFLSIARGAAIALAGAGLTAGAELLAGQDFGAYTPFVAAFASFMVNVARVLKTV